jgi:hypothetical protein
MYLLSFLKTHVLEAEKFKINEDIAKEPIEKLEIYKKELKELPSHIDQNIDDSWWDFDFERDEFMEKYEEFKEVTSKL